MYKTHIFLVHSWTFDFSLTCDIFLVSGSLPFQKWTVDNFYHNVLIKCHFDGEVVAWNPFHLIYFPTGWSIIWQWSYFRLLTSRKKTGYNYSKQIIQMARIIVILSNGFIMRFKTNIIRWHSSLSLFNMQRMSCMK